MKYIEEHGNRNAEKHSGPLPTEKIIRTWSDQKEILNKLCKRKLPKYRKHAK